MIVFRKFGGFYSVYDDDAIIMHYLFNYKVKDSRVGFPINSINKIIDKLKEVHIDYKLEDDKVTFKDNQYDYYLAESKNKITLDNRVDEIINKINKLDFNKLNELITIIDRYLDE